MSCPRSQSSEESGLGFEFQGVRPSSPCSFTFVRAVLWATPRDWCRKRPSDLCGLLAFSGQLCLLCHLSWCPLCLGQGQADYSVGVCGISLKGGSLGSNLTYLSPTTAKRASELDSSGSRRVLWQVGDREEGPPPPLPCLLPARLTWSWAGQL